MRKNRLNGFIRRTLLGLLFISSGYACPPTPDLTIPRIALLSAFGFEASIFRQKAAEKCDYIINGITFTAGKIQNKNVLIALTNISIVNASMITQLVLDKFNISKIIYSGISGGVNPNLFMGDVVVPQRWALYQEMFFAREVTTKSGVTFPKPEAIEPFGLKLAYIHQLPNKNFGMIYTLASSATNEQHPQFKRNSNGACIEHSRFCYVPNGPMEFKFWFEVDPTLFAVAESVKSAVILQDCTPTSEGKLCVSKLHFGQSPHLVVGGNGVSGPTFVDNIQYRQYIFDTYRLNPNSTNYQNTVNVLDMETAAVAMVAYSNSRQGKPVPFLGVRAISCLAGADHTSVALPTFMGLAIENTAAVIFRILADPRV